MIDLVRQQMGSLPAAGSAIEDPPHKDFENIGNTVFDRSCFVFLSLVLLFAAKVESLTSLYRTVIMICKGKPPHIESGQSLIKRRTSEFFAYRISVWSIQTFITNCLAGLEIGPR